MTDSARDGGPAFPCEPKMLRLETDGSVGPAPGYYSGMSLRDYFAIHTLVGLLASEQEGFQMASREIAATTAYAYADAMLLARKQGGGNE